MSADKDLDQGIKKVITGLFDGIMEAKRKDPIYQMMLKGGESVGKT